MAEASRMILGLREAGGDEKAINDFILYVETGEEQYKPKMKQNISFTDAAAINIHGVF